MLAPFARDRERLEADEAELMALAAGMAHAGTGVFELIPMIEQMGGRGPDVIICNSGLTESGYRFGRALPEIDTHFSSLV